MYKVYQEKRTEKVGPRTWEQSRDVPATTEFSRRSEKKMSRKIPRRKKSYLQTVSAQRSNFSFPPLFSPKMSRSKVTSFNIFSQLSTSTIERAGTSPMRAHVLVEVLPPRFLQNQETSNRHASSAGC